MFVKYYLTGGDCLLAKLKKGTGLSVCCNILSVPLSYLLCELKGSSLSDRKLPGFDMCIICDVQYMVTKMNAHANTKLADLLKCMSIQLALILNLTTAVHGLSVWVNA